MQKLLQSLKVSTEKTETHPSDHAEVIVPAKIDELPVEEPFECGVQSGVFRHFTRQDDAFADRGVHTQWRDGYLGWFCWETKNRFYELPPCLRW